MSSVTDAAFECRRPLGLSSPLSCVLGDAAFAVTTSKLDKDLQEDKERYPTHNHDNKPDMICRQIVIRSKNKELTLKVFLSWSGKKSLVAAQLFSEWLPCVIQKAQPWISSKDIDRGSIWLGEIYSQLAECNQGVVFVTKENQTKPWLLFETGALSKGISENRVCTFLVDLNVRDIESSSPLSHLNHTNTTKDQVLELIKTINKRLEDQAVSEAVLQKTFDAMWDEFSEKLEEIKSTPDEIKTPDRTDNDVLNDILDNVLHINRKVTRQNLKSSQYIDADKAREIIKTLSNLNIDSEVIFGVLSGITPPSWLKGKLPELHKDTEDGDFE
jgi:hypothetical protein